jgi:hypothetical protein
MSLNLQVIKSKVVLICIWSLNRFLLDVIKKLINSAEGYNSNSLPILAPSTFMVLTY